MPTDVADIADACIGPAVVGVEVTVAQDSGGRRVEHHVTGATNQAP